MLGREILSDRWVRASIDSIIKALLGAVAISASLAAVFLVVGLPEIAVPFVPATTIELGLIVISLLWRVVTPARPDAT